MSVHHTRAPRPLPPPSASLLLMADNRLATIEEVVDEIGVGFFQWRLLCLCSITYAADAMEIMLLSYLSPILGELWSLSDTEVATVASVVFAGELIGAFFWGYVGDVFGRRACIFLSLFTVATTGLASSFCSSFGLLLCLRGLVGFGVAGIAVPFDLMMEHLPRRSRGPMLVVYEFFWGVGSLFAAAAAWIILPRYGIAIGWRYLTGLCSAPMWLALAAYPWLPESPDWLLAQGRVEEAALALRRLALVNGVAPPNVSLQLTSEGSQGMLEAGATSTLGLIRALFCGGMWRVTLILWVVYASFGFTYYGAIIFFQRVFPTAENATATDFAYSDDMVAASSELAGTALTLLLIVSAGRVGTQTLCFALAGAAMMGLYWEAAPHALTIGFAFVARGCTLAANNAAWVITPELYPAATRATGHQWATAAARAAAFATPYVAGSLSVGAVALAYGGVNLIAAVFPLLLPSLSKRELRESEVEQTWPRRGTGSMRSSLHSGSYSGNSASPPDGLQEGAAAAAERLLPPAVGQNC